MGQTRPTVFRLSPSCTRGPSTSREPPATHRVRIAAFPCSPAQKDHHHVEHDAPGTEDDTADPIGRSDPGSGRRAPTKAPQRGIPALLVDDVTKRFNVGRKKAPVIAIANVSLRLERGGTIGILGANGSGKSTLIRLVSGLLTLDKGRVEVFGHDIEREEMAVKRLINRVSVDAAFFKKLSPMENLLFAARLYGIDAGRPRARRSGSSSGSASPRSGSAGRWSR